VTTSYNAALLASRTLYQVRFLLGDTGPTFTFQDEEINFVVDQLEDACRAAVNLAERRASILEASGGSYSIGDMSISTNPSAWRQLAQTIRSYCDQASGGLTGINIGPGGKAYETMPHLFAIGMSDDPQVGEANWPAVNTETDPRLYR
jgi:hypothetical protein